MAQILKDIRNLKKKNKIIPILNNNKGDIISKIF